MENEWMAYMYSSPSSLLNTYDVFGVSNFLGNNEEAACTLPPPCTGDIRVDEPFEDTKLVAALYENKNDENGNNVAAPPEMDTDSDVEWLESMPPEEELVSVADNGDQENNKSVVVGTTTTTGEEEFDSAANALEINWDEFVSVPPQEYINEEQYKQFLIDNNNNNVGEEEDASKNNNNVNADAAASLATTCVSGDNDHQRPKEHHINFPAAGNVGTAAAATSSRAPRVVWSEEEHKQFLIGLGVDHCNKGKWKRISAEFVPTKSPTQIASHAQKYFNHLDFIRLAAANAADTTTSTNNRKRRRSIHDTTLDD